MQLWIAEIPDDDSDELFEQGMQCVDSASCDRIRKFYRRPDAWRCLLGRLLVQNPLQKLLGHHLETDITSSGKPFIKNNRKSMPITYNVAHDSKLVIMAISTNSTVPPEEGIGVDIMRTQLHHGVSLSEFFGILREQLSSYEQTSLLLPHPTIPSSSFPPSPTLLQHIYWIWTLKESYTKCLGEGLGFDFSRLSFNLEALSLYLASPAGDTQHIEEIIKVDGRPVKGYSFSFFEVYVEDDEYQGVITQKLHLVDDGSNAPPSEFTFLPTIRIPTAPQSFSELEVDDAESSPESLTLNFFWAKQLVDTATPRS